MYRILDLSNWFDTHPVEGWLIIGTIAAIVGWVAWRYSQRQNVRSSEAAALLGFGPHPDRPGTAAQVDERLASLPLFQEGGNVVTGRRSKTLRSVLTRQAPGGGDFVFELNDDAQTRDGSETNVAEDYRVAAFRRHGRSLPAFMIAPEGLLSRIGGTLGLITDIDVPDHAEFSKRYVVRGDDIAAVVELLAGPPALHLAGTRGWIVQGSGEWLIAARRLRLGEGGQLGEFITDAVRVAETFGTT